MAPHSSILAWEIPWTEGLAGYSPWGRKRIGHDSVIKQKQHFTDKVTEAEWSHNQEVKDPRLKSMPFVSRAMLFASGLHSCATARALFPSACFQSKLYWSPYRCSQRRKRRKKEGKQIQCYFLDYVVVQRNNPRKSTEGILELVREFRNAGRYRLNILKLILLQATMSDHLERGIYKLTQQQ